MSPDGNVWTFKLRQGVKFHDGTPFNSQAVKFTIEQILDPATQANRGANYVLIKKMDTPDDNTIKFTTDPPNPDFPFLLADRSAVIISPTAYKKNPNDFLRYPVGTGPFKFEEWKPNDHISALLFENYWGDKPLVRRFVYNPIPEAAARVVVLKTGEADLVVGIPPADVVALKSDPNVVIEVTESPGVMENEPKQSTPPFSNVKVRYALNQSIDKKALITGIMGGLARELNSPAMPGTWGSFEFDPIPYDPEKAKQLLVEAGYPNGFDCTLQVVPGRWPGDLQVAEACQGYWARIGIRTTVKKIEMAEMSNYLRSDPDTLPGNMMLRNTVSSYTDYHLYRMYHSDATKKQITAQRYAYENPEVDKLINEEQRTFDPQKRLAVMKQAQELIWKDQPLVYLFQQMNVWGHRKNISGYVYLQSNEMVPKRLQKN